MKKHIDKKEMLTIVCSALLLITFIPLSIPIHESGHWIACTGFGFEASISLIEFNLNEWKLFGKVTCHDIEYKEEKFTYWVSGGLLSGVIFVSLLAVSYVRHNVWILAPVIAIICNQFATAYVETAHHTWYIVNNVDEIILTLVLIIGFMSIWLFSSKKQNVSTLT